MLVHWIWLAHRPKLSDWSKRMLLEHFRDPEEIYYADAATLGQCVELNAEGTESLKDKDLASCQEILEQCSRLNLHILTMQAVKSGRNSVASASCIVEPIRMPCFGIIPKKTISERKKCFRKILFPI